MAAIINNSRQTSDDETAAAGPARTPVLGIGISAVSLASATDIIMGWVARRERRFVAVTGVHGVIEAQHDPEFKFILNEAGLCVPDGMPMVWLSWRAGRREVTRVFGPDMMLAVSAALARTGGRAFYYGGPPGVAEELAAAMASRFPGLVTAGCYTPPFGALSDEEEARIRQVIDDAAPDVVWVGLSTPKQERWMARFRPRLAAPVLLGVGAAFDYNTGRIRRAPPWMQRSGLEWFYRLVQEPRRLFRRYARNNTLFAYYLLCERLRLRSFDQPPTFDLDSALAAPAIDRGRRDVLGVRVDAMNYRAVVDRIVAAAAGRQPLAVSLSAVHSVTTGAIDPVHRWRLNRLDLVIPDGQPVRWALNLLHGTALADRVYGPKLMCLLCREAAARGLPVYLYGSTPTVLANLERNLARRFPGLVVAGREPSQFRVLSPDEAAAAAERIRAAGPAIVFAGLGCPLQEIWVSENRDRIGVPLIAAGAAFDYLAGHLPQPPEWIQRRGLEWLFRLVQEPRRLWRRYMLLNPIYVGLVALQRLRLIRLDPEAAVAPRLPTNVG